MSTLVEKVYNLALPAYSTGGERVVFEGPQSDHQPDWLSLGDEQAFDGTDCLQWGYVYGVALGLARAEDPLAAFEATARRAQDAARTVWLDYAGSRRFELVTA